MAQHNQQHRSRDPGTLRQTRVGKKAQYKYLESHINAQSVHLQAPGAAVIIALALHVTEL
jgi:hypothetical protein